MNHKFLKKSQTATEYLIILAVVIIIALIVVGVLGGIPGIGKGATSRASIAYWKSADIAITDFAISSSGTDTIIIKNNQRNSVTVNDLMVNSIDLASGETLSPGASRTYTGNIASCSAGVSFSYTVSVNYQDSVTSGSYNFTGDNTRLEGTGAD